MPAVNRNEIDVQARRDRHPQNLPKKTFKNNFQNLIINHS